MAKIQRYWKSAAACLVVVIGVGVARPAWAQDTTTLLALFLRDLRNGTLGVVNPITKVLVGDGSASAPSYSFASDTGTGFYRPSGAAIDVVANTSTVARFTVGTLILDAARTLQWGSSGVGTPDLSLSRGAANRLDLATGDSFNLVGGGGAVLVAAVPVISSTAPTVTSAGTSPSVSGTNTAAFRVNVGTGGTATTIVMAMPTATTGWNCNAENLTANAANRANQHVVQQSSTTTAVTVQNQTISTGAALAFTASDIVRFICFAY